MIKGEYKREESDFETSNHIRIKHQLNRIDIIPCRNPSKFDPGIEEDLYGLGDYSRYLVRPQPSTKKSVLFLRLNNPEDPEET